MDRYADGDEAAFAEVYDGLAPRLYGYLLRAARDKSAVEDLVQQTFLRMHDARGRFSRGSSVEPWAFAIARRLLVDYQRWRRLREAPPAEVDPDAWPGTEPDGDAVLRGRELSQRLSQALEELSPQQREAFLLVREQGLSMAEAAEVLGTTVTAVKLRSHRAYEGLRRAMDDLDDDGELR